MLGNIVHIKQLLVLAIVADIEVKIALPAQKRCLCACIGFISADKSCNISAVALSSHSAPTSFIKRKFCERRLSCTSLIFAPFSALNFVLTAQIPFAFHADCIVINTVSSVFSGAYNSMSAKAFSPFLQLKTAFRFLFYQPIF